MIDNKQFILMREKVNKEGFNHIALNNGFVLSFQNNLNIKILSDDCILLGNAYSIKSKDNNLKDDIIQGTSYEEIVKVTSYWSGRWVLLWKNKIFTDASALLSVYYSNEIISSSLKLMAEYSTIPMDKKDVHISDYVGMNFFPGPLTPFPKIYRLLPSQIYDLSEKRTIDRRLLSENNYGVLTEEQKLELLLKWFSVMIKNMKADSSQLLLTITGGHDSRTMMALLEYSGVDYEMFTLEHPRMEKNDAIIPGLLAEVCSRKHQLVKRKRTKFSIKRYRDFNEHCYGIIKGDREFYAYQQYPEMKNVIMFRNSVWENVICWYETMIEDIFDIRSYERKWINVAYDKPMKESICEWIKRAKRNADDLDVYNKFFWEQRSGAWLASLEQGLDILQGTTSIQACNCTEIITLLYTFSKEDRVSKKFEEKIINVACPKLNEIPYAKKATITKNLYKKAIYISRRVCGKIQLFFYFWKNWGLRVAFSGIKTNIENAIRNISSN